MGDNSDRLVLEASWKSRLQDEFSSEYMLQLREFLLARKRAGAEIFPTGKNYFHAMDLTPFDAVKVVVLGQDPYHGPGQAHGLCFSVLPGVRVPPSLVNIYKEIRNDLGVEPPDHGYLASWARQGVFLLNSVLTVERGQAGAHQGRGWEQFTDRIVALLSEQREGLVFLLWGSYAQRNGVACVQTRPSGRPARQSFPLPRRFQPAPRPAPVSLLDRRFPHAPHRPGSADADQNPRNPSLQSRA